MAAIQLLACCGIGIAHRQRRRSDDLGPWAHSANGFGAHIIVLGDDAHRCSVQRDAIGHAIDGERTHMRSKRSQVVLGHPRVCRHRRTRHAALQHRNQVAVGRNPVLRACELEHPAAKRARPREQQRLHWRVRVSTQSMTTCAVSREQRGAMRLCIPRPGGRAATAGDCDCDRDRRDGDRAQRRAHGGCSEHAAHLGIPRAQLGAASRCSKQPADFTSKARARRTCRALLRRACAHQFVAGANYRRWVSCRAAEFRRWSPL